MDEVEMQQEWENEGRELERKTVAALESMAASMNKGLASLERIVKQLKVLR